MKCKTLYVSPRPSSAQFSAFYKSSPSSEFWATKFFPAVAEARRDKIFKPRAEKLLQISNKYNFSPEVIVDVGAGYGIFLEEVKKLFPKNIELCAIEPGKELADICRKKKFSVLEKPVEEATD
ncbi:MAG: hypothetical protein P1U63_02655 [Coxiellaceae bacterium]|nr:hypothetical protein [Coxiellaceae bacterium]